MINKPIHISGSLIDHRLCQYQENFDERIFHWCNIENIENIYFSHHDAVGVITDVGIFPKLQYDQARK